MNVRHISADNPDVIEQCNFHGFTAFYGWINEFAHKIGGEHTVAKFKIKYKSNGTTISRSNLEKNDQHQKRES